VGFLLRFTRENLKLGDGGEEGATTTSRERRSFHFVNDGIEHALDQAREAAGDRDVRAR
jgi:hypothetical protein